MENDNKTSIKSLISKKSSEKNIIIDHSIKVTPIEKKINKNEIFKCSCCGKEYKKQKGNFPITNSILFAGNNGYLTFCKDCVDKFYKTMVEFYSSNEEHALEHCCRIFDWYYSKELFEIANSSQSTASKIALYPSRMNIPSYKSKGSTYLDTVKDCSKEVILSADDAKEHTEKEKNKIDLEYIKLFGYGHTEDEYDFLGNQYEDWTTRYECKTKAQEELFKNLCITQLQIQKAQRNGDTNQLKESMKIFQDLLGSANIKPSQTDGVYNDTQSFGVWIRRFENEKPVAKKKLKEFEDIDGIQKYIETFFTGHLCKALDIKNPKEDEYKKELDLYTVKLDPEEDNEKIVNSVFSNENKEEHGE